MSASANLNAMMDKCRPLKVGVILILGMMLAMTLQMNQAGESMYAVLSLYAGAALTILMMFSLCEKNRVTAAWVTAAASPFVISLFAFQVQAIFGTAPEPSSM